MITDEELFMQNILEERDQLFRETSKLRSQIQGYENFESERDSYEKQLSEKDAQIAKLLERIDWLQRKIWGKSSESFIPNDPGCVPSTLTAWTCSLKKKSSPPALRRRLMRTKPNA